jgi:dienelactone hydrolase
MRHPRFVDVAPKWRRAGRLAIAILFTGAALALPTRGAAQAEAPGAPVTIPGTAISGWGQVSEFPGRFGLPAGAAGKSAAVLILHGSGGVDGRGALYARSMQDAGIATLEITMFPPGGRPRRFTDTMPHAAAALRWLGTQADVDSRRLGVIGFSWGGAMSMLMASALVQERFGPDVPRPVAYASLYPVCSTYLMPLAERQNPFHGWQSRMTAAPVLIYAGTRDDYEEGDRPCEALVATWPAVAREHATVRYFEGATHGFDSQKPATQFVDPKANAGRGGTVDVIPSPADAATAREGIVRFFVENLKRP